MAVRHRELLCGDLKPHEKRRSLRALAVDQISAQALLVSPRREQGDAHQTIVIIALEPLMGSCRPNLISAGAPVLVAM